MSAARAQIAIAGAGPARLMLSHLLVASGNESIVIGRRSRESIETTAGAGILEADVVRLLSGSGACTRVLSDGHRHDGIDLRSADVGQRIDFMALTGRGVRLYPQHEVLREVIAARVAGGQEIRFETEAQRVEDDGPTARVFATGAERAGARARLVADRKATSTTCSSGSGRLSTPPGG